MEIIESLKLVGEQLSDLSKNIVYSRPQTVKEQMKDFVYVYAPYGLTEKGAWSSSTIGIGLYCREKEGGMPNLAKLNEMVDKTREKFPITFGRYTFKNPKVRKSNTSDGLGFCYATIHIELFVNTTDKYNNI